MAKVIGIDLGTTNSVCAIIEGGEARVVISEEGGRVTPSVVGFAKDGTRFVGDIAKRQLLINPSATVHSLKRFIGKQFDDVGDQTSLVHYPVTRGDKDMAVIEVEGRHYTPQELSALILQKIKRAAEAYLEEPVTEAVITVPAYFTDSQRQATKDAGIIAGLDVLRIINEPTAAALAYVHQRKGEARIAVYDWGGGTFDISLLKVDSDIAEVLSTRGNNVLGGGDVDQAVVNWLVARFKEDTGLDVSDDSVVMQRLRDAAERAKIELSSTQCGSPALLDCRCHRPEAPTTTLTREDLRALETKRPSMNVSVPWRMLESSQVTSMRSSWWVARVESQRFRRWSRPYSAVRSTSPSTPMKSLPLAPQCRPQSWEERQKPSPFST